MNGMDRVPPHSEEAEAGVLGSALLDGAVIVDEAIGKYGLKADSFYSPELRAVWTAVADLHEKQQQTGKAVEALNAYKNKVSDPQRKAEVESYIKEISNKLQ